MLDREDIRAAVIRHCAAFDEADLGGVGNVWAQDCTDIGHGGQTGLADVLVGRDALLGRIAPAFAKFRWTHHHLGESTIEIHGDVASAMTYVACWHEMSDGERCWGTAQYHDEFRRDANGHWLITSRRMILTGAEGAIAAGGGTWLNRHLPPSAAI
jgi:ketosteroid isomerase-like protein